MTGRSQSGVPITAAVGKQQADGFCPSACLLVILLLIVPACSLKPLYPEAKVSGADVVIDTAGLQEGIPSFYTHSVRGVSINFFVVRIDGRILSFFDACTKCHPRKKGFRFDSSSVVCRACDERFPVSEIEHGVGSCFPIRVSGRLQGDRYLIPTAELVQAGEKLFR